MPHYPIFLQLENRASLVVGGGKVAERKVGALRKAGSHVTVISPTLTEKLAVQVAAEQITHRARRYIRGDVNGFSLVFAATGDQAVDAIIAEDASAAGVLLNVVDRPQLCSFIVPATLHRGALSIAISTGGASPAMARRLREDLEQLFGEEYARALEILGAVRQRLQAEARPSAERQQVLTSLVRSELLDFLRAGRSAEVDHLLGTTVGDGTSVASLGLRLD
jgi:precorrin-2 dehydrogenase/sirohydrochlorin ferrochelatase